MSVDKSLRTIMKGCLLLVVGATGLLTIIGSGSGLNAGTVSGGLELTITPNPVANGETSTIECMTDRFTSTRGPRTLHITGPGMDVSVEPWTGGSHSETWVADCDKTPATFVCSLETNSDEVTVAVTGCPSSGGTTGGTTGGATDTIAHIAGIYDGTWVITKGGCGDEPLSAAVSMEIEHSKGENTATGTQYLEGADPFSGFEFIYQGNGEWTYSFDDGFYVESGTLSGDTISGTFTDVTQCQGKPDGTMSGNVTYSR